MNSSFDNNFVDKAKVSAGGSSTASFRSPTGKRMHPRAKILAETEFNGTTFPIVDLSVGGFAFLKLGPQAKLGDPVKGLIHIGGRDLRMTVEITARVVRSDKDCATAVQFIDLPIHSANAIDWLVEAWLNGQTDRPPPLMSPMLAPPMDASERFDRQQIQSTLLLIAGALVAIVLLSTIVSNRLVIQSDFAAVSAPLRQLRAPQDGVLSLDIEKLGTLVYRDQLIGRLQPIVAPNTYIQMQPQIQFLQNQVTALQNELADASANVGNFRNQAEANLVAASQSRQLIDKQVKAQDRLFQRLKGLAANGLVATTRVDQEEVLLMTRSSELAQAIAAENAARLAVKQGQAGKFLADGRPVARSPRDVRRELAATRASLAETQSVMTRIANPLPLLSPCECVLAQLAAATGTALAAGDPIASLAVQPQEGTAEVDALVPANRLTFLRTGQEVRVFVGGQSETVSGRILSINYNPANAGRIGLPAALSTQRAYGLVTVSIAKTSVVVPTGMPAVIEAPIELQTLLTNIPGWSRIFGRNVGVSR